MERFSENELDEGLDLSKLDCIIQHAEERQTADDIVTKLRENREGLVRLIDKMEETCCSLKLICESIQVLLPKIRDSLTIVIPPGTVKHLEEVFSTFVRMFDTSMQTHIDADIKQLNDLQQAFLCETKRNINEIVKMTDKVLLSPYMFACLLLNSLFLAGYFAIALYLSFKGGCASDFRQMAFVFLAIIIVVNIVVIVYNIWSRKP